MLGPISEESTLYRQAIKSAWCTHTLQDLSSTCHDRQTSIYIRDTKVQVHVFADNTHMELQVKTRGGADLDHYRGYGVNSE